MKQSDVVKGKKNELLQKDLHAVKNRGSYRAFDFPAATDKQKAKVQRFYNRKRAEKLSAKKL
ncbi:hypothetical protein CCR75_001462 [Bremia lactucae]|uniref:Uncharacterized protein n=1 Tax=Bremia lactucae TaxID=4779 RepID=A0A976P0Q2_BRELC|nr:hypothetical protein CCR75_001462 [Bremia lactucae]